MRFKILYKVDKLPVYYRNVFMSLIKEALKISESGKRYIEELFEYQENDLQKVNKSPRPFCFAVRFQFDKERFKVDKETFYLNSPLEFYLSSIDPAFFITIYNGLINNKIYPFSHEGTTITKDNVIFLNERRIDKTNIRFKTLSPILIENKEEKPLLPIPGENEGEFKEFKRELNFISDSILRGIRKGIGLRKDLDFIPLTIRKEVVKHKIRERNEIEKIYTFTCFNGIFELQGDSDDLACLYRLGIGLRRAQGFGMVEVV